MAASRSEARRAAWARWIRLAGPLAGNTLERLRAEKRRVLGTALGVVWSTVSIVLLLAFGHGFHRHLDENFEKTGDRWISFIGQYQTRGNRPGRPVRVDAQDIDLVKARVEGARYLAGEVVVDRARVTSADKSRTAIVSASSPELRHLKALRISRGRYFTEDDERRRRPVAVLGDKVATLFFGSTDPIGRVIKVEGHPFEVIGVLAKVGDQIVVTVGPNDETVWLPLRAGMRALGRARNVDWLYVEPERTDERDLVAWQVRAAISEVYGVDSGDQDAFRVVNLIETIAPVRRISAALPIFLGAIGTISLAVAGLAVANLMIAEVVQRRVELAVERALGARRSDLMLQVLVESLLTVVLSGVVGIVIAAALITGIGALDLPPMVPKPRLSPGALTTTFVFLTATGLLSGLVPARLAASADPSAGLRST